MANRGLWPSSRRSPPSPSSRRSSILRGCAGARGAARRLMRPTRAAHGSSPWRARCCCSRSACPTCFTRLRVGWTQPLRPSQPRSRRLSIVDIIALLRLRRGVGVERLRVRTPTSPPIDRATVIIDFGLGDGEQQELAPPAAAYRERDRVVRVARGSLSDARRALARSDRLRRRRRPARRRHDRCLVRHTLGPLSALK